LIRLTEHEINGGKVDIVSIRVGPGARNRGEREGACGGYVDRGYLLNQLRVAVVQSDVADVDDIQQRGYAIVQPGHCALLVAGADPVGGRVDDV
jgi:hypothetical protein